MRGLPIALRPVEASASRNLLREDRCAMARRRVVISFETDRLDSSFFAWLIRVLSGPDAPKDLEIRMERIDVEG